MSPADWGTLKFPQENLSEKTGEESIRRDKRGGLEERTQKEDMFSENRLFGSIII